MHYVLVETGEAGPDDRLETCFGDDKLGAIRACNRIVNGLAANGWTRDEVVFAGSSYTWRKPGEQARTVRVAEYAYCDQEALDLPTPEDVLGFVRRIPVQGYEQEGV